MFIMPFMHYILISMSKTIGHHFWLRLMARVEFWKHNHASIN